MKTCIRTPAFVSWHGRPLVMVLGALAAASFVVALGACESTSDSYTRRSRTTNTQTPEGTTKTTETKTKTVEVTPK